PFPLRMQRLASDACPVPAQMISISVLLHCEVGFSPPTVRTTTGLGCGRGRGSMSRRSFATARAATTVDPSSLLARPGVRVPDRIVLDILMLLEIGLVVVSATLAKLLYIAVFLDSHQDHKPYLLAGLAGGIVIHYMMRMRGLHEPAAFLEWRARLGELLVAI